MKRVVIGLVMMLALCVCGSALAALPETLASDFAPVDGLVLVARDGEVLIDAAAEKGVRVGELFSLLAAGEPLRHPVSGAVIGRLDRVTGLLAVTQVRSGFAVARQLSGDAPQAGAGVRRFDQVKAWFVDPSGQGEALFAEARAALPHLDWQPYTAGATGNAGNDGLQFVLSGDKLDVRGGGELLHSYRVTPVAAPIAVQAPEPAPGPISVPTPTLAPAAAPTPAPVATLPTPVPATPQGAKPVVPQAAKPVEDRQPSKWLGATVKRVPVALAVADLDGDGRQEVARAFADGIEIGRLVAGDYSAVQSLDLPESRKGQSLAVFDLDGDGRPEIFYTATFSDRVLTTVYEFDGRQYNKIADDQPWFVNVVDLAGGPALLGQRRVNGMSPFAPTINRLRWQGSELAEAAEVRLPSQATVYAIAAFPAAGAERFVRINDAGRIVLCDADDELWASSSSGDTETGFKHSEFQTGGNDELSRTVFLPGPLYAGADGLVVTAFNSGFTASAVFRQMTGAEIIGWRWEGYELTQKWRIADIEGYIPALTIADADNDGIDELVLLVAYPNANPFGSRRSAMRLLALN